MKRSRLRLFKTTSLTISLIGVILILITIGIIAYVAVSGLTSSVSTTVGSGASYDQLSSVKSEFNNVTQQYNSIASQVQSSNDETKNSFNTGKLKINEANQTISEAESDISSGKSEKEVGTKINKTKDELNQAKDIYSNITTGGIPKGNTSANSI